MVTKKAGDIKVGDVIELWPGEIRTVESFDWHPQGIPDQAVVVKWIGRDHQSTIAAGKDLTIAS